ncbi:hypothetical protein L0B52_09500 [Suttonella sp. R2A3]|uniref:DUF6708 domain-containing protein n=1 Tax=Suttonella sp. R2A3 TaxID=2908648 RepID=UPI001F2A1887|nr:DUF6708 domain-containing protein [Suttonella sp. R2A3]UJF24545.1 hypothetical protein L0B52_09500 [Suttonella sp. R2A3]
MTGREAIYFTKDGYGFVGKPYDNHQMPLNQSVKHDVPLRPQRTVIQFNSTYMELIDRWDATRGEVASWFSLFLGGFLALTSMLAYFIVDMAKNYSENIGYIVFIGVLFLPSILFVFFCYKVLRLEVFSHRYFPLRFNRKTGKVHVLQATGKVQTFNWKTLKINMVHPRNDQCYVRCCEVDNNNIIQKTFSLPFISSYTDEDLISHFEFVNRYMQARTDKDLAEVASSIRYLFPVHERRETIKESFEHTQFEYHHGYENMEYPEQSFKKDWTYYINTPFMFLKFLGRLLSVYTSKQPTFSAEIEAQSTIDPDDKFDLNKNPPVPELIKPPTLIDRLVSIIMFVVALVVSLSIFALVLDAFSTMRPAGDYPGFFKGLWDVLLFRWLNL